jgi:hypothetical protein
MILEDQERGERRWMCVDSYWVEKAAGVVGSPWRELGLAGE